MEAPGHSWLPTGMDPKSSYLLEIRLSANPKKRRKDFSYFTFSKVVDSDLCNFKDLVREIVDQYPHGYQEVVHVFYYDGVQKYSPEITTDQELLEMFRKHVDSKVVHMTITYTDPTDDVSVPECYTTENSDVLDPSLAAASHRKSTEAIYSQLTKPSTSQPTEPSTNKTNEDDVECLANPRPQNEHVGVDDEAFYLPAHKTHVVEESDSESDSESDVEYVEEDGLIGKDPLPPRPIVAYDRNDPPMSVGSIYPNMKQFDHNFFMHPPLLKPTAGRRQNERFKGCTEGSTTKRKGSHQCKVCKNYGHRWYKCKDGDPDDIAAMLAEKGPPKKRKTNVAPPCESSIVPVGPKIMHFSPSRSASVTLGSGTLGSGNSVRSGSGSNQPEPLSMEYPALPACETTPPPAISKPTTKKAAKGKAKEPKGKAQTAKGKAKAAGKKKKKEVSVPHDSPAMGTRSKTTPQKDSPASQTRSKRKLPLPDLNG